MIKIYSTPTCPYCTAAKDFLKSRSIEYEEIDVSQNETRAQEMIKLSGQMGVPVIVADKKVIIGFDQAEIEKAISAK